MKVAVYSCALNEEQFVERWSRSAAAADHILVLDTGSTDRTVETLRDFGVAVGYVGIRPFRFDDAKNAAMHLLPPDMDIIVHLDLDEILLPHWRDAVEIAWKPGTTRLHYKYIWSWTASGRADLTYYADKICGRHTHRWKNPVHEVLVPTVPEIQSATDKVLIEHHPDATKSRSNYFNLLKLAVAEEPLNDRNCHYLGREFYFNQQYENAINEFKRHIRLPTAQWSAERAASLRYGAKSYECLGNLSAAYNWYVLATLEDSQSREALVDLASFLLRQEEWTGTVHYAYKALQIPADQSSYINERYALEEGPYDLAAVALFKMEQHEAALYCIQKALEFNPTEPRLLKNLSWISGNEISTIDS